MNAVASAHKGCYHTAVDDIGDVEDFAVRVPISKAIGRCARRVACTGCPRARSGSALGCHALSAVAATPAIGISAAPNRDFTNGGATLNNAGAEQSVFAADVAQRDAAPASELFVHQSAGPATPSAPRSAPVSDGEQDSLWDVIIIGAGVVGCAIARELSKYDARVLLLEKSDDVSQGASKSNSGIVHGGYDEKHGTLKSKLSHAGNRMFAELDRELHFGFRPLPSLVVAFSPAQVPVLEALLHNGRLNGVRSLRILDQRELLAREPSLNSRAYAALFCPDSGVTSPYEYTIALAENAIANGVTLLLTHEVLDLQRLNDSTFLVKTVNEGSRFRCKFVINCAGLYSDKVAAMVGANNFSIVPRKGFILFLVNFCSFFVVGTLS